jgi:hypothetical protein
MYIFLDQIGAPGFLGLFLHTFSFVIPFVILYVVFYAYIQDCHQVWLNLLYPSLYDLFVSARNLTLPCTTIPLLIKDCKRSPSRGVDHRHYIHRLFAT